MIDLDRKVTYPSRPLGDKVKMEFPAIPAVGCVGVAPPNKTVITAGPTGPHGGNIDYNGIGEGTTVYLNVFEPGALFFLGDGHAAHGDGELLAIIGRWKTHSLRPQQAAATAETDKEHMAAVAYRRYQQALKNAGAVDFDDLLLLVEELFSKYSSIRQAEASFFDHVLIDEYQDTNATQYRIVQALAADHRNLCVVGDDDQSIYGWRGAQVEHILRFKHDWPDANVVRLEENYRSTAKILELANRLITFNKVRHDKVLRAMRPGGEQPRIEQFRDEMAEAKSTAMDIQKHLARGHAELNDFAILFRTNEQPRAFETELRHAKLPYVLIGGMSFFDRKEVRDVLAYLRVLDVPRDEVSLLRIINTPARGLSQKTVETLRETATSQGTTVWDVLTDKNSGHSLSTAARAGADQLEQLISRFRKQVGSRSIAKITQELVHEIDYEGHLRSRYEDPNERDARWNAVEEVVNAIASYEKQNGRSSLTTLLDDLALGDRDFDNDKEDQLKKNAIALMTLHSAKGLEFPFVYMVGLEEGLLPHRRSVEVDGDAIDEERRLCYVGITRAQERLTLSLAQTRMKWGKARETQPSRFLFEMIGKAEKA
ncbi:MAG: UvrD-helicase domain-containing protein [Planctomycetes bacterium]|nr:UvrD-helicase domain-containing protein [Planctomycetota bacterium]